jgi:hypothetical protein
MQFRRIAAQASAFAAVALVCACSGDPSQPQSVGAELEVLHATASLGAVDVSIGDRTVITGVAFGRASARARVDAGQQHLTFRSGGAVLGEIDAVLSTSHVNAVVVANGTPHWSSEVIPDTGVAVSNRANLRIVNVVGENSSPPTHLQLLLNAPDNSPDSTVRIGLDTRVASYSSLMYWNAGHFKLRYVPEGTETVLVQTEFDIAAGEKKVAVLERNADGSYRVQVVIEP